MKKIVLTGGGTAGHVTPNLALLPALKEADFTVSYIGSYEGIEKQLIKDAHVPYYPIASGQLRRYFDWKNFTDPFRVIKGYGQALHLLRHLKPDVVFSKGGFVSVPVVLAARQLHIPAIIHESDMTPGLANKIAIRGATKVCCNFPETLQHLPADKAVLTGSPIREELRHGDRERALRTLGFSEEKPILMIMGGSIGSVFINTALRDALDELLPDFQIIHLCGKGNLDPSKDGIPGYRQFEYVSEDLPDFFAAADLLLSRAGANAICEILALRKPNILVPLSRNASRGDQILNAKSFEKQGFSYYMEEESVTKESLVQAILYVRDHREDYIKAMRTSKQQDSVRIIVELLTACTEGR
ncbi:MAG: undecaprenyldiphospho-muramoylpentapeptide beta-N-acetylglucosaminyltransferase [Lachnospiraceae bacterium]|nr:undecaprenyldiphospho-muramoylpentapeptide beta-N-acetylglucosaminyltransferase [Lachnospiraceae bacterium]